MMQPKIHTNPYRPDPAKCCEACVFGEGAHADFCEFKGEPEKYWFEYCRANWFPGCVPGDAK